MDGEMTRRNLLAGTATTGAVLFAGCSDVAGGRAEEGDGDADGTDKAAEPQGPGGDVDLSLSVTVRDQHNAVWDRFEELTVRFDRLTFVAQDGAEADITVGEELSLMDIGVGKTTTPAGSVAMPEGVYETARLELPVQSATVAEGAADLPLARFESQEIDLEIAGTYFDPTAGQDVTFTLFLVVSENLAGDAYRLDVATGRAY